MVITQSVLEGEAPEKSFGTRALSIKLCVYIGNNHLIAVQSLQLQQIGQLETYCFPTLVVNKFIPFSLKFWLSNVYSSVE